MTEVTITRSGGPKRPAGRTRLIVAALTCGGVALIAGCSSSSPSGASGASGANKAPKPPGTSAASPGSPTASGKPNAAACVHINSVRTSLTSLTHITVSAKSASQLAKDLANIDSQLSALKGQNLGSFSAQASELRAEMSKINKDAAELNTNPAKGAKALTADLTVVRTKAGPMIVQMKKVCHTS